MAVLGSSPGIQVKVRYPTKQMTVQEKVLHRYGLNFVKINFLLAYFFMQSFNSTVKLSVRNHISVPIGQI